MIDSFYRASFQRCCVDPVVRRVAFYPNAVTLCSLIAGVGAAAAVAGGCSFLALFLWMLSGYLDVLDGSLARAQGISSPFGTVLDLVSDRMVEFAFVMALFAVDTSRAVPCLWMLGSMYLCIASFFSVSLFTEGKSEKSFVYSPGIIERSETFIVFACMIFLEDSFFLVAMLYSGLVYLTTLVRLWEFFRSLTKRGLRGR